ncbi:MAG: formate dehydrogenase [Anaerolineales bacterium]|nr:formate dehydrogenase [Anaerolineales bacterium]
MRTVIPVENGDAQTAVQGFLRRLLEAGVVEAVLVAMETPADAVTPALVTAPGLLDAAAPLAPVMGLNAARVVGHVSARTPRGRIAAVLRPCELRALVELVKVQQASLDDLLTVGVDCLGTYDVPAFNVLRASEGGLDMPGLLGAAQTGDLAPQDGFSFRDACQMCEAPQVERADIAFELFGADLAAGIPVSLPDEVADTLGLTAVEAGGERHQVIAKVVAARTATRDTRFAEIRQQLDEQGIEGVFASCIRCHNCMTACPICYCRTCLFKSPVFEHDPMQYVAWARRKGAYRLPADTMLFHLTRLNHMALSCIGCGMCTSACPADLPVGRVFRAIGSQVQATFEYVPGRDVAEPLPLVTFREDEWQEVGEE